jgi:hypothetical protein
VERSIWIKQKISNLLIRYLTGKVSRYRIFSVSSPEDLLSVLQVADVILVEGNQRFSTAVKYLTQSTWSHAALFVGAADVGASLDVDTLSIIEADLENGVIAVPLSKYADLNTRICRPVGLDDTSREAIARFMRDSIGMSYDLKNVVDLARFLLATPPVPSRWRRKMLALGSGDPTRVICSTRIAQAFQHIGYPILPSVETLSDKEREQCHESVGEIYHIRHHSLFTPRDFDVSPYFEIVKPTVERGFDHKQLRWGRDEGSDCAQGDDGGRD